jgi:hypothetical protein
MGLLAYPDFLISPPDGSGSNGMGIIPYSVSNLLDEKNTDDKGTDNKK